MKIIATKTQRAIEKLAGEVLPILVQRRLTEVVADPRCADWGEPKRLDVATKRACREMEEQRERGWEHFLQWLNENARQKGGKRP